MYIWHQMAPWTFVVAKVAIWRHMPVNNYGAEYNYFQHFKSVRWLYLWGKIERFARLEHMSETARCRSTTPPTPTTLVEVLFITFDISIYFKILREGVKNPSHGIHPSPTFRWFFLITFLFYFTPFPNRPSTTKQDGIFPLVLRCNSSWCFSPKNI